MLTYGAKNVFNSLFQDQSTFLELKFNPGESKIPKEIFLHYIKKIGDEIKLNWLFDSEIPLASFQSFP